MGNEVKWPTKLDKDNLSKADWVKLRTLELYDYLPQTTLEERYTYTDIRDEIIELNYAFFGYVATHTFINNSSISYEDKFQSALYHFCTMWHKFRFAKKYRTDLSFAVFFKPRIGECIERELNEVKYSLRRSLCMEAGAQLGKHWGQVKYEDLKDVKLSPDKMQALQAMFGTMYWADLETHALFIAADSDYTIEDELYSDNYDSKEEMLIHEMILQEKRLDDADLLQISIIQDIPFDQLKKLLPKAEDTLYRRLQDSKEMREDR